MKKEQVAVQLYTVRDWLKTPADIARSFRKLRETGFAAVELASLDSISDADLKTTLDGEGLACFSSHEPGDILLDHTDPVIEKLTAIKCPVAVYPYPAGVKLDTLEEVLAFTRRLDAAGSRLAKAGIFFAYHNHNIEFRRIKGKLMLDLIFDESGRQNLGAEIDVYWVQAGGGDPSLWCRKLKGRLPLLHMKDFGVQDVYEGVPRPVFKEVGRGNLDWKQIIKEAERAGCRRFVVEQDANWIENDPFESLKASWDFISGSLCS